MKKQQKQKQNKILPLSFIFGVNEI